jgi:hypothetical protein
MKEFKESDLDRSGTYPHLWVEDGEFIEAETWWQKRNLMYTSTGYGKKIPTDKMVRFEGRDRRVYCCIYSNAGTCYIVYKGEDIIIN